MNISSHDLEKLFLEEFNLSYEELLKNQTQIILTSYSMLDLKG